MELHHIMRNVLYSPGGIIHAHFEIGRPDLPAAKLVLFGTAFDESLTNSSDAVCLETASSSALKHPPTSSTGTTD